MQKIFYNHCPRNSCYVHLFAVQERSPAPCSFWKKLQVHKTVQTVHVQILKGIYVSSFSINSIHVYSCNSIIHHTLPEMILVCQALQNESLFEASQRLNSASLASFNHGAAQDLSEFQRQKNPVPRVSTWDSYINRSNQWLIFMGFQ